MRKHSLYILISVILVVSVVRSVKNLRSRCYGVLNMLWCTRDDFRTYSVVMNKESFPFRSVTVFACGTKENGRLFIEAFYRRFPSIYNRTDFMLTVDGMWTFLPKGVSLNIGRYAPDNYGIRNLLKRLNISETVAEDVIAWTNNYWTSMLKSQYC